MFCQEVNNDVQVEDRAKDRCSAKTCDSSPEKEDRSPVSVQGESPTFESYRLQLFETSIEAVQISQKVNQRAISWMITICWSKSFSQECLCSTLLLYYSFKAKKMLRKQQLELTLLSCLSLSLKMTTRKSYPPRQLAALSSRTISGADIVDMEETILAMVDYNVVIPHQLCELMRGGGWGWRGMCWGEERVQEILLICELLMLKDYSIFLNRAKLECIVKMLGGEEMQKWAEVSLRHQIRDLLNLKQCRIIINKYSSRLDTELFKRRFL